jgi:hypothetical protein
MRRLPTACAFLLAYSGVGSADLFIGPGTGTIRTGDGFSLGAEFTYNGPDDSTVTDLGMYDYAGETWDHSHEIGLWDLTAGNTQIADATVDNSGTLILPFGAVADGYRYVHLLFPPSLHTNHTYILAAYYYPTTSSSDHLHNCCSGTPPTAGEVPTFSGFQAMYSNNATVGHLSEPDTSAGDTAYVGPNLQFQTPEPATFALTGCGALALLLIRKTVKPLKR